MTLIRFTVWFVLQVVFWCICVPALVLFVLFCAFMVFGLVWMLLGVAVPA